MEKKIQFSQSPSVLAYMMRAIWPSGGFKNTAEVPNFKFLLPQVELSICKMKRLYELCGLSPADELPVFFPQVIGFPLVMRAVTDPQFPEPIWNALQTRNKLIKHRSLRMGEIVDFELRTGQKRFFAKGAEVDFEMSVKRGGELVWEGITTFYYRGNFGREDTKDFGRPPELLGTEVSQWRLPDGGGFSYGRLSGDYNGIHLFTPYAKMFGFKKAFFFHPHRVVGQIFANLSEAQRFDPKNLELWFRGPVPYQSAVRLELEKVQDNLTFGLFLDKDPRPCIIGRVG